MYSCGPLGGAQRPARRCSGFRGLVGRTGCCDGRTRAPRAAASCSRWMFTGSAAKTSGSIPSSISSSDLTRAPAGTGAGRGGRDDRPRNGGAPLQLPPFPLRLPPLLTPALVPQTRDCSLGPRDGATDAERREGSVTTSGLSGGTERRRSYSASSSWRISSGSAWKTEMSTCENDGRSTPIVSAFGSGGAVTSSLEDARGFGADPIPALAPVEFGSRRNGSRA